MTLKIKILPSPEGYTVPLPSAATAGSAGLDLAACLDRPVTLRPGEIAVIPCGAAVEIPAGHVGLVFGRSGLGIKHGVTLANSVGVIDSDYRGELRAGLINRSGEPYTVQPGERIAQLVILPYAACTPVLADELSESDRGAGGFGSTGR